VKIMTMKSTAQPVRQNVKQALTHPNLPLLMLQGREHIIARFRPLLKTMGLTEQQWRIVRALLERGALEPRQIGQICCLSSASLVGILARMDDMGLVSRERPGHDQRRVMVSVSAKGRKLAAQLAPQIEATYRAMEEEMGPELTQQLYAVLQALGQKLGGDAAPGEDAQVD
jgi:homoprotocatechuate degradation regulator HpaR